MNQEEKKQEFLDRYSYLSWFDSRSNYLTAADYDDHEIICAEIEEIARSFTRNELLTMINKFRANRGQEPEDREIYPVKYGK